MKKATLSDLQSELWARTQRENLYWETKSGEKIPLKQMSTEHLINALNYFRRIQNIQEEKAFLDIIYEDLRGLSIDDIS